MSAVGAGAATAMVKRRTAPRTFEELRAKVLDRYDTLSTRQRQFARYLLDEPDDLALETIAVMSRRSRVAPAAIVRFAQRFGFKGASQMRRLFRDELLSEGPKWAYGDRARQIVRGGGKEGDALQAFLEELADRNSLALANLIRTIGEPEWVAAVDLLQRGAIVHVVGAGSSFPIAAYLAYSLQEAGKRSVLNGSMAGLWRQQVRNITSDDVLVAVSYELHGKEMLQAMSSARAKGARVLALTDSAASHAAKSADVVLQVREAEVRGVRSLSASMYLVHALAVAFAFKSHRHA